MATDIKGRASVSVMRLGEELRAHRRAAAPDGLTLAAVVEGLKKARPNSPWDQTKLSRIERATLLLTAGELDQLLDFYGLEGEDRDILTNLRTEAPTRRWWLEHEDVVTPAFGEFLQLESEARGTTEYAAGCNWPGLFQGEEAAAKAIEAGIDRPGGEQIDSAVAVRTKRQQRLYEEPKLQHTAYFSEVALLLEADPKALARQISYAIEIASLGNVGLRMVPTNAGRAGMLNSGLVLMEFGDPTSSKHVFVEAVGGILSRGPGQAVKRAESAFARLDKLAYSPDKTLEALKQKLETIS